MCLGEAGGGGSACPRPAAKQHSNHDIIKGEHIMKPSTKDELEGKLHEAKGKVDETLGHVTNNPDLEAGGQDEKLTGKVQKKLGQVEKVLEK
jgi:uncharacterized protein YjbJ (UPF0337 family)